jgi:hypothetical protein
VAEYVRLESAMPMKLPEAMEREVAAARARVRLGYPWWLAPLLMAGVLGITLGRRIYLSPQVPADQLERLLRHELTHVRQVNRVGLLRFYGRYLAEYLANRRAGLPSHVAYRRISFEEEAERAEQE